MEHTPEGIRVQLRPHGPGRWFPVGFLLFWLAGWSGGGASALSWLVSGQGDPFIVIWLAFWLLGVLAAVGTLVRLVAGSDSVLIARDRLDLRGGPFGHTRSLERSLLRRVVATSASVSVETATATIRVTDLGSEAERLWLQRFLAQRLGLETNAGEAPDEVELLQAVPPEPAGWVIRREPAHVVLTRPARSRWATAGGLLALNLFWNGIVGVFVAGGLGLLPRESIEGPAVADSPLYWLFLTPFIAIGLCMMVGLLSALFVMEERWVGRHHYEVRSHALGRTWSRTLGPGSFAVDRSTDSEGTTSFTLVLVTGEGRKPIETGAEDQLVSLGRFLAYYTGWLFRGVVTR